MNNTFTHEELNKYLDDWAYNAESTDYPEVGQQIRDAKTSMSLDEKFKRIGQEYDLFDPCGCKVVI